MSNYEITKGRWAAAERYAAAEPSDPFLRNRMAAHMRNGVASFRAIEPDVGGDAFYSATEGQETRTYDGFNGQPVEYQAVVYTQRRRP